MKAAAGIALGRDLNTSAAVAERQLHFFKVFCDGIDQ